jgi:hypothetical protein
MENILNEHYVTVTNNNDMNKYVDIVWDMLQNAYKEIGGFLTAKTKDELIKKSSLWKMVRRNGKILAVKIYTSKKGGRKSIACATNGTQEGKDALYSILKEDIKMMDQRQAWAEVSGKMEYLYNKFGGVVVPSKYVQDILKDKEIFGQKDDGHYSRNIKGEPHEKIMFGWIDPEIKQQVDNRINESYDAVDIMTNDNRYITSDTVTDKKLMNLFDESDRIISNFIDDLYPLRRSDVIRLKQLKRFYFECLFNDNVSDKFKDYCEIEIDEINDVLEKY